MVDFENLTFKDALARLGLSAEILGPRRETVPVGWQPQAVAKPAEVWADKARKFALWCHERLLERPEELAWLEARGVGAEMVKKYRLGWNPSHAWRDGSAWGLQMAKKDNGQPKKLWLPRGLVIPWFSSFAADARVLRLRIRQPDQQPRYLVIQGSSREPLCSGPAEAMVVVESELDAILLDGVAGDVVGVVAMGNDSAKPTETLAPQLEAALCLLVALDSDQPRYNPITDKMEMAGAKSSRWWLEQYAHAQRVPVIGGKDPGEAYAAGVNLRSWVLAALPAYFHVKADLEAARQARAREVALDRELAASRLLVEAGMSSVVKASEPVSETVTVSEVEVAAGALEGPVEKQVVAAAPAPAEPIAAGPVASGLVPITVADGRSFVVTRDRKEWEQLTEAGELVFSEWELKRLQAVCGGMNQEERAAATLLVLDIKEVFPHSWIKQGLGLEEMRQRIEAARRQEEAMLRVEA